MYKNVASTRLSEENEVRTLIEEFHEPERDIPSQP